MAGRSRSFRPANGVRMPTPERPLSPEPNHGPNDEGGDIGEAGSVHSPSDQAPDHLVSPEHSQAASASTPESNCPSPSRPPGAAADAPTTKQPSFRPPPIALPPRLLPAYERYIGSGPDRPSLQSLRPVSKARLRLPFTVAPIPRPPRSGRFNIWERCHDDWKRITKIEGRRGARTRERSSRRRSQRFLADASNNDSENPAEPCEDAASGVEDTVLEDGIESASPQASIPDPTSIPTPDPVSASILAESTPPSPQPEPGPVFRPHFWPPQYVGIVNQELRDASSFLHRAEADIRERKRRESEWKAERDRELTCQATPLEQEDPGVGYDSDLSDFDNFDDTDAPLEPSKIGHSEWSGMEKEIFFHAVARDRRDWPAISKAVQQAREPGSPSAKSALECQQYASILSDELKKMLREREMNLAFGARRKKGFFGKRDIDIYADMLAARDVDTVAEEALSRGADGLVRRLWKRDLEDEQKTAGELAILGKRIAARVERQAKELTDLEESRRKSVNLDGDDSHSSSDDGEDDDPVSTTAWWKSPVEGEVDVSMLDRIPAARLLKLQNMIRLSTRVFMNSDPEHDHLTENWTSLINDVSPEMTPEPSMMFSCFQDFAQIAQDLTVKLIQASIHSAERRLQRTRPWVRGQKIQHRRDVRLEDVRQAVSQSGLRDLQHRPGVWTKRYWQNVPRRCGLTIDSRNGILTYDEVERKLRRSAKLGQRVRRGRAARTDVGDADEIEESDESIESDAEHPETDAPTPATTTTTDEPAPRKPLAFKPIRLDLEAINVRMEVQQEVAEDEKMAAMDELLMDEYVEARDEWANTVDDKCLRETLLIVGVGEPGVRSRGQSRETTCEPGDRTGTDVGMVDSTHGTPGEVTSGTEDGDDDGDGDSMSDISTSEPGPSSTNKRKSRAVSISHLRTQLSHAIQARDTKRASRIRTALRQRRRVLPLPIGHPARRTHRADTTVRIEDWDVPLRAARRVEWRSWADVKRDMFVDWVDKAEAEARVRRSDRAEVDTA